MRPLIGMSTYVEPIRHGTWDEDAVFTPATYVNAVERSGGIPVLLPPAEEHILDRVDGLVLIGGPDVDPARYGAAPHPSTDRPRERRDGWEATLCRSALATNLPLLAICRGMQVLNVAMGGTLVQDIDDHRAVTNGFSIEPGSRLAAILPGDVEGRCHHHQAVDRLAAGLTVAARAADGTVEAVEATDKDFAVAVQWHPEEEPVDDRLIAALVEAARNRRDRQ